MKRFEYVIAESAAQALARLGEAKGQGALKAGGIDLLDRMKSGISTPGRLINLGAIAPLRAIKLDGGALRIGATVTLSQLERDADVRRHFAALAEAAGSAANPHIRNVATVAGNLLQRPRCWYYRNPEFQCLKKGGHVCFAQKGENRYHAIFGGGPSWIVHPSTLATALVALGGRVVVDGPKPREIDLEKFFVLPANDYERENVLGHDELITEVRVPDPGAARSAYMVVRERQVYDWPLGEVAVALWLKGKTVERARVVLGAAAPIPWRSEAAERALVGKTVGADVAQAAGHAAVQGAKPLGDNGYKVPMFEALVARAVLAAAEVA